MLISNTFAILLKTALVTSPFWVWDLSVMPPGFRHPDFALEQSIAVGKTPVHLWTEVGAKKPVTPLEIAALVNTTNKHIAKELSIFGEPPFSLEQKYDVHVVLAEIKPYVKNGKSFGSDGYFNIYDQFPDDEAPTLNTLLRNNVAEESLNEILTNFIEPSFQKDGQHSNQRNVIYLNSLSNLASPYMQGVYVHELAHLLTFARHKDDASFELEPWVSEMLGEAAMQMADLYTDHVHAARYMQHLDQPLAVTGYGLSYGALSMFSEFLISTFGEAKIGELAKSTETDSFRKFESVYGLEWNQLFESYLRWLYQRSAESNFHVGEVTALPLPQHLQLAPTAVFFAEPGAQKFEITKTPENCSKSSNTLRVTPLTRAGAEANAIWIESSPPCSVSSWQSKEQAAQSFKVTTK